MTTDSFARVEQVLTRLRSGRAAPSTRFDSWSSLVSSTRLLLSEFSDDPATLYSRRSLTIESLLADLNTHWRNRRTLTLTHRGMTGVSLVIAKAVAASSRYSTFGRPTESEENGFAKEVNDILTEGNVSLP